MRPFRRRRKRPAEESGDQQLRPAQLENTLQYGWRDITPDRAKELVREAVERESASPPAEEPSAD